MKAFLDFMYSTDVNRYFFSDVTWNVFLALIPCCLSFVLYRTLKAKKWNLAWHEWVPFTLVFLLWIAFLPNTVYLFTMIRHLLDYCRAPTTFRVCPDRAWQIMFFFGFALLGVPTFVYSLERMTRIFRHFFGKLVGFLFPILIIPVITAGLLLGLIRRFNSWDLLQYPLFTANEMLRTLHQPGIVLNFSVYLVGLYSIYYLMLWFFSKILKK
ncbi:DUF1361 domain-containing protein [Candidatus Peregrinibacteria bacterium]|nr:DUF1361 domain-containing protein [Candidatus Peregrinibacteria bacterium]